MGRPPIGKVAMTATERVHRFRAKHRADKPKPGATDSTTLRGLEAEIAREREAWREKLEAAAEKFRQLRAKFVKIEAELAHADETAKAQQQKLEARIRELEAELAALKAELADSVGARFAPGQREPTKPKAEKPPLPLDEERDRQIKGLKTRVRNLTSELHAQREWHRRKADGSMSFQTMSAIAKALHPEQREHWTRAELDAALDEACKAFMAWKADKDKARRRDR